MSNGIVKKIIKASKQGVLLKRVISKLNEERLSKRCCKRVRVENKKLFFITFQGRYTCNPKYICNEIIRQGLEWDLVWAVNAFDDYKNEFPEQVRTVEIGSEEYFKELYSSHLWIDNAFCIARHHVKKRPEHVYVETMHGSLGIKRIGPEDVKDKLRNKRGFRCGEMTDFCISNSSFETEVYKTSFWANAEILEYGHARNDFLLTKDEEKLKFNRKKVHLYFNIADDVKIALYAPTFRDDDSNKIEKIDYPGLKEMLKLRFGGEWAIIYRTHAKDANNRNSKQLESDVYCGADYPDIQELMLATEVGITDYSSWIFDYVLLKRPGFLYAPDLKKYDAERGFYYPIETSPFPVTKSNEELKRSILGFDEEVFLKDVEKFLENKGCVDDGNASSRIVEKLKTIIEGK